MFCAANSAMAQTVEIKSGKDVNIKSGGKVLMEGTQIDADGHANIDAKGGVDKQTVTSVSGKLAMDDVDANYDNKDVNITEGKKGETSEADDMALMTALLEKTRNEVKKDSAPKSSEQMVIMMELESVASDKTLTPAQKEKKRAMLEEKLESQKALDLLKQDKDKEMSKATYDKIKKELDEKIENIEELMKGPIL
jgi:hypothetical protein